MITKEIDCYTLHFRGGQYNVSPPFSILSALVESGEIQHPYYSGIESEARDLLYNDCVVHANFALEKDLLEKKHIYILFEGIDTVSNISLNGRFLGRTENMHRIYTYDVREFLREDENTLDINIFSPIKYVMERQCKNKVYGFNDWMRGFAHIRKAHYSFGWDWAPQLPDMGIHRKVYIKAYDDVAIENTQIIQKHAEKSVFLDICSQVFAEGPFEYCVEIFSPEGDMIFRSQSSKPEIMAAVEKPQLWWPNGLGEQPLYKVIVKAVSSKGEFDEKVYFIGLRTLDVCRERDALGSQFCFMVNGKKIFSMGGNFVPQDSMLKYVTKERTARLLKDLKDAHFNTVRVWGGGYYPDDDFYDQCDRLGLIVWQDFMFACTTIYADKEFKQNIREEFIQNLNRIRHHACLGLLCGNNEIEMLFSDWKGYEKSFRHKRHYSAVFEKMLPKICRQHAGEICYIPSSPTSGGKFKKPNAADRGDTHFWEVWHGLKPFEEYQNHYFRFCSEFGFESFPDIKTMAAFAKEALNPFSEAAESHQKCSDGNARILYHISKNYLCPSGFEDFIFISQILQNDAVKFNVEHLRRNRPRCMGALYWQINDCWPAVSWSSIDYFGRWKALHYGAKRFFAPVMVSLCKKENRIEIHVCNETLAPFKGRIEYCIASDDGILEKNSNEINVPALTSKCLQTVSIRDKMIDVKKHFFAAALYDGGGNLAGTACELFVKPKHFDFRMPNCSVNVREEKGGRFIDITTDVFTYYLQICFQGADFRLSDNFMHITPLKKTVTVQIFDCNLTSGQLLDMIRLNSVNQAHLNALRR
jgi:beta-mannosidase